jgi:glycerophosphoryl diester phosphodiesterase
MLPFIQILTILFLCKTYAAFDWQGHRGARGLYPENTINGMKEALKFPITTLEMDVVISKDERVVVGHEPWMSEEICLDPKGKPVKEQQINLYALNYAQIKLYDCGSKKHPRFPQQKKVPEFKPLLGELLTSLESSKIRYNIEIKSTPENEKSGYQPDYKKFSNLVVAEITKHISPDRLTIQSFDWRVLKYLHESYPDIELVALRETNYIAKNILDELGFSPSVFSPDWKLLTAADVEFFHAKKIKVVPWTVNNLEDMKKMIYMGVDGIITDYPNLIIEIPLDTYKLIPECLEGRNRFEGKCIKIPKHAEASDRNPGWVCKYGFIQKRNSCEKIKLPRNAVLGPDGKTWTCGDGFKRYRLKCVPLNS